jgi:hypothetical protein
MSIPYVGSHLNVICALINAHHKTEMIDKVNAERWVTRMLMLGDKEYELHTRSKRMKNGKKKPQWKEKRCRDGMFSNIG